jgi:hypothetical protein
MAAVSLAITFTTGKRVKSAANACCRAMDSRCAFTVSPAVSSVNSRPSTLGATLAYSTVGKQPSPPAGSRPARRNCAAMYSAAMSRPGDGVALPLQQVGGQEGNVGLQIVGRQANGDLPDGGVGLRRGESG